MDTSAIGLGTVAFVAAPAVAQIAAGPAAAPLNGTTERYQRLRLS